MGAARSHRTVVKLLSAAKPVAGGDERVGPFIHPYVGVPDVAQEGLAGPLVVVVLHSQGWLAVDDAEYAAALGGMSHQHLDGVIA